MTGLRERTRQAVRTEIARAAERLFLAKGFEATTIDDIAAEVGMSQRSVFRYFATKDEILVGKFELVGEDMLAELQNRPTDEHIWTALVHVFDVLAQLADDPGHAGLTEPIHRVVFETPSLQASYLQKLQVLQEKVVAVFEAQGTYAADDPTPRALTAAAFGCLVAAQHAWLAAPEKTTFSAALHRAMATLRPA